MVEVKVKRRGRKSPIFLSSQSCEKYPSQRRSAMEVIRCATLLPLPRATTASTRRDVPDQYTPSRPSRPLACQWPYRVNEEMKLAKVAKLGRRRGEEGSEIVSMDAVEAEIEGKKKVTGFSQKRLQPPRRTARSKKPTFARCSRE